ncbi:polysaccharide deacetylase family protein [Holdemania massiliensis]|uniref:polysaccharide deacetylase family protein n=1 Tax=Holdemania massiliensis TaxID=1468449 RepID=UPI0002D29E79|nr:polysaccharide deacetylase family protein [Holdemania massiliensis]
MKYNIFTVDVEGHVGTDPVNNLIYADLGNKGKWGIDKIMDICKAYGVKGLFFVDIAEAWDYGEEKIAGVLKHIQARGHDVGVHIHPDHMADRKRLFLWEYTYEEQYEIIKKCTEFYVCTLGKKPIAFRAGKYGANYDTLDILSKLGYLADFSEFYGQKWCGINPPLTCTKLVRYKSLLEVPTTAYMSFNQFGYSRFDKLDTNMDLGEFRKIVPQLVRSDEVDVIVSFAHSFSLIDWRTRKDSPKANLKLALQLERMFQCLEEKQSVKNVSLEQLLNETKERELIPSLKYVEMKGLKSFLYFGKRAIHVLKMKLSSKVVKGEIKDEHS